MKKIKPQRTRRTLLPAWDMPSDPVKAVWWFMHWSLKVLVRYFWVPLIVMVVIITASNAVSYGIVSGLTGAVFTALVGLIVWAVLSAVLRVVNTLTGISQVISDAQQMQQNLYGRYESPFASPAEEEHNVVEGSIIEVQENSKNGKNGQRT
ncbi:MAG: hypothetical protein IMW89_07130 [Ktedonobacteraceae bacterium]|nr:hypothetical protein [Ktedonobacteraceae bacterium]